MTGTTCQKFSPVILLVKSPVMVITSPSCKGGGLGSGVWAFGFWGVFMVIFVIYPCIGYGFIFCENFSH